MIQLNYVDFKKIAEILIRNLTPKSEKNIDKVLDFIIEIKNEEYQIRAYAPCNYRGIWIKFPKAIYENFASKPFYKDRLNNGWVMVAYHDSCWTEGLSLNEYTNFYDNLITFKELRYGTLRTKTLDFFNKYIIDEEKGEHLLPVDDLVIDLSNMNDILDLYVQMFKLMYQDGDTLCFDFRRKDVESHSLSYTRMIQIMDINTIKKPQTLRDKTKEKIGKLNRDNIIKFLGKGVWQLEYVQHSRKNEHFF